MHAIGGHIRIDENARQHERHQADAMRRREPRKYTMKLE
jgi:hypothetical protein